MWLFFQELHESSTNMWEIYSGMSIIYGARYFGSNTIIIINSRRFQSHRSKTLHLLSVVRRSSVRPWVCRFSDSAWRATKYSNGHYVSTDTYIAWRRCWLAEKPERNWSVARRYSVVRWQHCLLLRLIVDLFSENVRFEVDVNR